MATVTSTRVLMATVTSTRVLMATVTSTRVLTATIIAFRASATIIAFRASATIKSDDHEKCGLDCERYGRIGPGCGLGCHGTGLDCDRIGPGCGLGCHGTGLDCDRIGPGCGLGCHGIGLGDGLGYDIGLDQIVVDCGFGPARKSQRVDRSNRLTTLQHFQLHVEAPRWSDHFVSYCDGLAFDGL